MPEHRSDVVVAAVDDDESVLRSLAYLLESADYAVRLFTSAEDLLRSGCLPKIACLVSDIDMPSMDGIELLRRVGAARPDLPTILITGYPSTLTRLPTAGRARVSVFTKPFEGHQLLAAVADAIGRSAA